MILRTIFRQSKKENLPNYSPQAFRFGYLEQFFYELYFQDNLSTQTLKSNQAPPIGK